MSAARLGTFLKYYPSSKHRTRGSVWALGTDAITPLGILKCTYRTKERQLISRGPAILLKNWTSATREERHWGWSGTRGKSGRAIATLAADNMAVGSVVEGLQPASLWKYFEALSKIPRPSKFEERVLQFLKEFAAEHELQCKQDEVGNLIIKRPGTGGGEDALPVIIQGHVDMVTEKDSDSDHDFMKDPLRLHITHDGRWLKATGTTLGADNGIGVAAALALLTLGPEAKLPPLECLFTVDEETGLTGAFRLDGSLLKGRTMLNLDTEDWGELFIGCAGGGDSMITLPVTLEAAPSKGYAALDLRITGLMGGHSGLNIHEGRGNAVQLAARVVDRILHHVPAARLASISGGDKRNAIAREATALVLVPKEAASEARLVVENVGHGLREEYGGLEKDLQVSLPGSAHDGHVHTVMSRECETKLIALLRTLPHGVIKFSHAVPGLVETSTNLASVKPENVTDKSVDYAVQCCTRSSLMDALESTRDVIRKLATLCGASVEMDIAYPGWNPNPSSHVLQLAKEVVTEIIGHEPKVGAIHAGLECGIIGEKLPGVDTVSLGPTIRGAHSPDEKVEIATVQPFWEAVLKILARLADIKDATDSD